MRIVHNSTATQVSTQPYTPPHIYKRTMTEHVKARNSEPLNHKENCTKDVDDENIWTPLQIASSKGDLRLVSEILSRNANPNEPQEATMGKQPFKRQQRRTNSHITSSQSWPLRHHKPTDCCRRGRESPRTSLHGRAVLQAAT